MITELLCDFKENILIKVKSQTIAPFTGKREEGGDITPLDRYTMAT